jgi:hypothetical protein
VSKNGKEVSAGTQTRDAFDWKPDQPDPNTQEEELRMAKKLMVFLAALTLVAFVACKKEETTNIDATTDTVATDTSMTSSTEYSTTDTSMTTSTDTMATDTMGTGSMSDTMGTGGTMTGTSGTAGTTNSSTTASTTHT